jgi:hypothetical protein
MRASVISAAAALALLWAAPAAFGQAVTEVTVSATPSPSRVGESVQLSARVRVPSAPAATPTGTIQFEVDGTPLGTPVALSSGVAATTTATLAVGTRSIVARYHSNSGGFADSTGNGSQVVNKWASQVGLTVVPEPAVAGQPVTLTATVSGAGGARPTGTIQFRDEVFGPIGAPVALDGQGVAQIMASAGAGTYHVRAEYSGDGTFDTSFGTATSTFQRAATTTTLTSSANPASPGAQIVFKVVVGIVPPGDVAPFGTLQATVNGQPFGDPFPLEGYDTVTLTVRAPTIARSDVITVTYSGDENTLPSSASLTQVVGTPRPEVTPTPTPTTTPAQSSNPPTVTAADLKRLSAPLVTKLKRRGARALNGARLTFTAPTAGTLQQTVRAGSLLASAKRTFTEAGRGTLTLKLTAAGRRQIRRSGSVKLTIVTTFTPRGGTPVRVTERVTVRRAVRASAAWHVIAPRLTRR